MTTPELLDYIKKQLQKGSSEDTIKKTLAEHGWRTEDIEEGFSVVHSSEAPAPSQQEPQPINQGPVVSTATPNIASPVQNPSSSAQNYPTSTPNQKPISQEKKTTAANKPMTSMQPSQPPIQTKPQVTPVGMPQNMTTQQQAALAAMQKQENITTRTKGGKKSHAGFFIFLLFLIIIIGGAGYAIAQGFVQVPFDIPFLQKTMAPEEVVTKAFENQRSSNWSFAATNNVTSAGKGEGSITTTTSAKLEGTYISNENQNPNIEANIEISAEGTSAGAEVRMINDTFYFQVTKLPIMISAFAGNITNQWFTFGKSEMEELRQEFGDTTPIEINQVLTKGPNEIVTGIQGLIRENFPLTITADLGYQKIDNQNHYHYEFILDKDKVLALTQNIIETWDLIPSTDYIDALPQLSESLPMINGEIWINKKDFSIKQITIQSVNETNWNKTTTNTAVSFAKSSVDMIEVPQGAESIITSLFAQAHASANDTAAQAFISQVRAQAEIDEDYTDVCSGATTSSADLIAEAESMVGNTAECKDERNTINKGWAVSLMLSDQSLFCADSSGFAGKAKGITTSGGTNMCLQ